MELEAPPNKVPEFEYKWRNWLHNVYEKLRGPLWEDNTAELRSGTPGTIPPSLQNFGPGSVVQQYMFNRGESLYVAFHINHDIKPGSLIYPHVHWSTDGTAAVAGVSDIVEWELDYIVAKGHQQETFSAGTQIVLTQSVFNSVVTSGPTAWHHYIVEASDTQAITAPEVDALIMMRVRRGSTSDTYSNAGTGHVFGLYVDLHYQLDRFGTPNKSPDFYRRGN